MQAVQLGITKKQNYMFLNRSPEMKDCKISMKTVFSNTAGQHEEILSSVEVVRQN